MWCDRVIELFQLHLNTYSHRLLNVGLYIMFIIISLWLFIYPLYCVCRIITLWYPFLGELLVSLVLNQLGTSDRQHWRKPKMYRGMLHQGQLVFLHWASSYRDKMSASCCYWFDLEIVSNSSFRMAVDILNLFITLSCLEYACLYFAVELKDRF